MQLTFLGATQTVTGSKYLLDIGTRRILIDCGLFQGQKELRLRNWESLPIDPASINTVILTHAHIDHSGYLPLLVKNGFTCSVYTTQGTKDLCSILLPDSGYLQEEEACFANRHGYSTHKPALPLYTEAEAEVSLAQFIGMNFYQKQSLSTDCHFQFIPAGHIIGSAFVYLKFQETSLLFSGDVGRFNDPIMRAPTNITGADYLVLESTYGNRLHSKESPEAQLKDIIIKTAKRGGMLLIPAFAVGRAQSLLYYIYRLKQKGEIPNLPVFVDSPLAIDATQIFYQHSAEHRLNLQEANAMCQAAHYIRSQEESKKLDCLAMPSIIISASGMAAGGRVLYHLKMLAPDSRNTILFAGYQAAGTRGADIVNGKQEIKIHGEMIPIRAHVESLTNISAHADYEEILAWLKDFKKPPRKVFITHGEPEAAQALKEKIENQWGWTCVIPSYLQEESL